MPYVAHKEAAIATVTIKAGKGTIWTLSRLKGIAAFLGALITFSTTVLPLPGDQHIYTGIASVLTFVAVYGVPNIEAVPKRAQLDSDGDPVVA